MTQSREALTIMAESGPTFSKAGTLAVPRWAALLAAAVFVVSLVVTGLVVYSLTSCPPAPASPDEAARASGALDAAGPGGAKDKIDVRLPRSVRPVSYEISLLPFIKGNFSFRGEVAIILNVTEATNNVTLHAHELAVDESSVALTLQDVDASTGVPLGRQSRDPKRQFYVIKTKMPLKPGTYRIKLKFTGILSDDLQGFYRSSYIERNVTRWVAVTQFQSTDARRAFPCFDEPALKARFKLHLARPVDMTTVSNMPQQRNSTRVDGVPGYVWDHYEESVPMSTYLVAFAVTDFESRRSSMRNGTFAVWTRSEAVDQAKYALEIGPRVLEYFEKYFNIRYPLPKMDMMALPDFAAGAMENWGLITYREIAMLYQEGVSMTSNKQQVATVVAHELAHQWFGNLVTPSWWSDLWLNEGFASYVEYFGVNAVEPSWLILDQFVVSEVQMVFGLDALQSSHPVSIEVGNPDEIN
ncbi:aminopeptidase N-like, partial [Frankliniella occidentalis]|uniref:Aminopeptidase N-like n=1 Tax=Frankliniella occidentalis TaxID=133901 RepID=A0A9C6WYE7_FRAOC